MSVTREQHGRDDASSFSFDLSTASSICVVATSGGSDEEHRPASATISIDGVVQVGPDRFNQNVTTVEQRGQLDAGRHSLAVDVTSKPGTFVSVAVRAGGPSRRDGLVSTEHLELFDVFASASTWAAGTNAITLGAEGTVLKVAGLPSGKRFEVLWAFEILDLTTCTTVRELPGSMPVQVPAYFSPSAVWNGRATDGSLVRDGAYAFRLVARLVPVRDDGEGDRDSGHGEEIDHLATGLYGLNVDRTPPVVTITSPIGTATLGSTVPVDITWTDPVTRGFASGVDLASATVTLDGLDVSPELEVDVSGGRGSLRDVVDGVHFLSASIADLAGNVGSADTSFTVDACSRDPATGTQCLTVAGDCTVVGTFVCTGAAAYPACDTGAATAAAEATCRQIEIRQPLGSPSVPNQTIVPTGGTNLLSTNSRVTAKPAPTEAAVVRRLAGSSPSIAVEVAIGSLAAVRVVVDGQDVTASLSEGSGILSGSLSANYGPHTLTVAVDEGYQLEKSVAFDVAFATPAVFSAPVVAPPGGGTGDPADLLTALHARPIDMGMNPGAADSLLPLSLHNRREIGVDQNSNAATLRVVDFAAPGPGGLDFSLERIYSSMLGYSQRPESDVAATVCAVAGALTSDLRSGAAKGLYLTTATKESWLPALQNEILYYCQYFWAEQGFLTDRPLTGCPVANLLSALPSSADWQSTTLPCGQMECPYFETQLRKMLDAVLVHDYHYNYTTKVPRQWECVHVTPADHGWCCGTQLWRECPAYHRTEDNLPVWNGDWRLDNEVVTSYGPMVYQNPSTLEECQAPIDHRACFQNVRLRVLATRILREVDEAGPHFDSIGGVYSDLLFRNSLQRDFPIQSGLGEGWTFNLPYIVFTSTQNQGYVYFDGYRAAPIGFLQACQEIPTESAFLVSTDAMVDDVLAQCPHATPLYPEVGPAFIDGVVQADVKYRLAQRERIYYFNEFGQLRFITDPTHVNRIEVTWTTSATSNMDALTSGRIGQIVDASGNAYTFVYADPQEVVQLAAESCGHSMSCIVAANASAPPLVKAIVPNSEQRLVTYGHSLLRGAGGTSAPQMMWTLKSANEWGGGGTAEVHTTSYEYSQIPYLLCSENQYISSSGALLCPAQLSVWGSLLRAETTPLSGRTQFVYKAMEGRLPEFSVGQGVPVAIVGDTGGRLETMQATGVYTYLPSAPEVRFVARDGVPYPANQFVLSWHDSNRPKRFDPVPDVLALTTEVFAYASSYVNPSTKEIPPETPVVWAGTATTRTFEAGDLGPRLKSVTVESRPGDGGDARRLSKTSLDYLRGDMLYAIHEDTGGVEHLTRFSYDTIAAFERLPAIT